MENNRIALVIAVVAVAVLTGVAVPAVIPATAAVNTHIAQVTNVGTSTTQSCLGSAPFQLCLVASGNVHKANQTMTNQTMTMGFASVTPSGTTSYTCQIPWSVQMSWKNSEGTIVVPTYFYLNSAYCQKVSG